MNFRKKVKVDDIVSSSVPIPLMGTYDDSRITDEAKELNILKDEMLEAIHQRELRLGSKVRNFPLETIVRACAEAALEHAKTNKS